MEKAIKEKVKVIEKYICENFDELDMDDPVEEGYFDEYEKISGANDNWEVVLRQPFFSK